MLHFIAGSVRYASINCHNHVDLGRVDDLWSWMYSLVELKKGKLPWSSESSTRKTGEIKMKTTRDELLQEMEPEFHTIYKHFETLKYESTPLYHMYKEEFTKIKKRKNYSDDAPFDWEEGANNYIHSRYTVETAADDNNAVVDQKSKKDTDVDR